ncbi:MAG: hypothetical protein ACI87E_005198 [Mariniblastus sp.]|jgi:hypothetical protein
MLPHEGAGRELGLAGNDRVIENDFSVYKRRASGANAKIFSHFSDGGNPIRLACMDDVRCLTEGSFHLPQRGTRSMPIESLNSVIALGFITVWLMVGQFSFMKS